MDKRYFGMHHDMPPESIAAKLGGTLVWKKEDQGQWVGLIRFNRQFEARLNEFAGPSLITPDGAD
jgi:hypothetical protein